MQTESTPQNKNVPKKLTDGHYLQNELYALVKSDDQVFDFLQEGSLDGLWYWDLENPEHEWMSDRFWQIFGYDPKTKTHHASEWQDMIHPEDLKRALENFEAHRDDPSIPYDLEVRYRHRNGSTVWVRCRGKIVRNAEGQPIRMLGAHQDITQLKIAENRAKELAEQLHKKAIDLEEEVQIRTKELEESNKRLSQFAYVISHDLKAPLRGIRTCVDWLEQDLKGQLSTDSAENFEFIKSRSERLANLIDGVLTYSQVGFGKQNIEPFKPVRVIQKIVDDYRPTTQHQIIVNVEPITIEYDKTEFNQVAQNLINNAIGFMNREDGCVQIRCIEQDKNYRFEVEDNGPGIRPNLQARIFGLFETLQSRDAHESTGIGLSVCKTIVERNGGEIGVDSDGIQGSTFWFTVLK